MKLINTTAKTNWTLIVVVIALGIVIGGMLIVIQLQETDLSQQPKQISLPSQNLGEDILVKGRVIEVDVSMMPVDGPAIVTLQRETGEKVKVLIAAEAIAICKAKLIYIPEVGSEIEVFGRVTGENEITPCDSSRHHIMTSGADQISNDSTSVTANWQIYRNEEFGFEVKYPQEWEIKEEGFSSLPRILGIKEAFAYTGPEGFNPVGLVIFGNQAYNGGGSDVMFVRLDVLNRIKGYPLPSEISPNYSLDNQVKYEIAGQERYIRKHLSTSYNPTREGLSLATDIRQGDILFQLQGYSGLYNQDNEELLLKILSTFRFVGEEKPITVLSPNGGEVWRAGEIYTITWANYNVENVIVTLLQGTSRSYLIGPQNGVDASLRKFDWKIDATDSYVGRSDLRVVLYDAEACDYVGPDIGGECRKDELIHGDGSDGDFSVVK